MKGKIFLLLSRWKSAFLAPRTSRLVRRLFPHRRFDLTAAPPTIKGDAFTIAELMMFFWSVLCPSFVCRAWTRIQWYLSF